MDSVWFHSRNSENSTYVRTRELLAKLAKRRIISGQTGREEKCQDPSIIHKLQRQDRLTCQPN